jgi:hypothetical protein
VPKFDECFQAGDATKLRHQSLVMDGIHKGKSLTPSNGSKVPRKVQCKILGMFIILTKFWHQSLMDPTTFRK